MWSKLGSGNSIKAIEYPYKVTQSEMGLCWGSEFLCKFLPLGGIVIIVKRRRIRSKSSKETSQRFVLVHWRTRTTFTTLTGLSTLFYTVQSSSSCSITQYTDGWTLRRALSWDWVQMDRRNVNPLLLLFSFWSITSLHSKDWGLNEDVYTRSVSSSIDRATSNGGCGLDMRATVTSV